MIPKNAIMIWMQGFENLPDKLSVYVNSVIEKNPTWNILKFDDKSIRTELQNLGQQYLDKYNGFKLLHQQVDFARYCLVFIYGGIAIDTDALVLKGFDSIPNIDTSDFIVSEKPHNKSINNATILTSKNNHIMKYVIDNIDTKPCREFETDYKCIQRTTGPYAFDKLLKNFRGQITVLDKSYLEPCASVDPYCSPKENSVIDHRHELSWLKPSHKKIMKLYFEVKHYKYQILIGIIIIIALILILRKK